MEDYLSWETIYEKRDNIRKPSYAIWTSIVSSDDGEKRVLKHGCSAKSLQPERIFCARGILGPLYNGTQFVIPDCELIDTSNGKIAVLDYIEGEPFEKELDKVLETGDINGLKEAALEMFEKVLSSYERKAFVFCDEFIDFFGKIHGIECAPAISGMNIDAVFSNIIVMGENTDKYGLIDYEWTFDFLIPVNFLLYRCVRTYIEQDIKRAEAVEKLGYSKQELYLFFGLTEDEIFAFDNMEQHFQGFVNDSNLIADVLPERPMVLDAEAKRQRRIDYLKAKEEEKQITKKASFMTKSKNVAKNVAKALSGRYTDSKRDELRVTLREMPLTEDMTPESLISDKDVRCVYYEPDYSHDMDSFWYKGRVDCHPVDDRFWVNKDASSEAIDLIIDEEEGVVRKRISRKLFTDYMCTSKEAFLNALMQYDTISFTVEDVFVAKVAGGQSEMTGNAQKKSDEDTRLVARTDMIDIYNELYDAGKILILVSDNSFESDEADVITEELLVELGMENVQILTNPSKLAISRDDRAFFTELYSRFADGSVVHVGSDLERDYAALIKRNRNALYVMAERDMYYLSDEYDINPFWTEEHINERFNSPFSSLELI